MVNNRPPYLSIREKVKCYGMKQTILLREKDVLSCTEFSKNKSFNNCRKREKDGGDKFLSKTTTSRTTRGAKKKSIRGAIGDLYTE